MLLGDRLKGLRLQRGLTLNELAESISSTVGYLSNTENNKTTNPTASVLIKFAEFYEVSIDYLLSGIELAVKRSDYDKLDESEKRFIQEYIAFSIERNRKKNEIEDKI